MNARADDLHIEEVDVAIIGTGFAGLGMAIQMKKDGMNNFVVLEKAADLGGTWRDNHYPGCACDVPSHLYSFSFEQNPNWSETYSPQPEIWEYLRSCANKYNLMDHIRFNKEVVKSEYQESDGRWRIPTADGQVISARSMIAATGGLSRPAYPNIKGLDTFKGEMFHSQDWNHDYDFKDKRVAVIGTGASAIQFVPQVAKSAGHLDLFQRTPPWIMPKLNRKFSDLEHTVFGKVPFVQKGLRTALYWVMETQVLGFVVNPKLMKGLEFISRKHFERQIPDAELRAKVMPNYTIGCKRILYSNNYLPALTRPNVSVVTDGVAEITPTGIKTQSGELREADCIILGTGFQATSPVPRGAIFGKGGVDLLDRWDATGMQAYKGTTVSGFPNMYFIVGPNTGLGHSSIVFMIESQVNYIMKALRTVKAKSLKSIDVKPAVMDDFNNKLQSKLQGAVWSKGGCASWYLDTNGKNSTLWPNFTWKFRLETKDFDLGDYSTEKLRNEITTPDGLPIAQPQ